MQILVNKCIKRDITAWDIFYKRYKIFVLKCVKFKLKQSMVTSPDFDALDITHDIFYTIWNDNKLACLDNAGYLKSWLSIFSINFTRNYLRKNYYQKKNKLSLDTPINNEHKVNTIKDLIPDPRVNIINTIDSNDLYLYILTSINKLPKKQKIAIKLNILFGKKHTDISRIMHLPLPTVSSLILRSKKIIRKKIFLYFQNN